MLWVKMVPSPEPEMMVPSSEPQKKDLVRNVRTNSPRLAGPSTGVSPSPSDLGGDEDDKSHHTSLGGLVHGLCGLTMFWRWLG